MASCLLPVRGHVPIRCHVAGRCTVGPREETSGVGHVGSTWHQRGIPTATPRPVQSIRRQALNPPTAPTAPSAGQDFCTPVSHSSTEAPTQSSHPESHSQATPIEPLPSVPAPRAGESFHPICPCCSRRGLLIAGLALASTASLTQRTMAAGEASLAASSGSLPALGPSGNLAVLSSSDSLAAGLLAAKQGRPQWVDELYAYLLGAAGDSYEAIVGDLKKELFAPLLELENDGKFSKDRPLDILEVGVGSGPNMKLYAGGPGSTKSIHVTGIDPNGASEKYAAASASAAGLGPGQFSFLQGVGEGIPLADNSVDVAITTLVLCSVADVQQTVSEVFRVLRPGGQYLFLEHVAAAQGTPLRFWQNTLDPLQQFVADGCHLTREPLPFMESAGFARFDARHLNVPGLSLLSPHLVGRAFKA